MKMRIGLMMKNQVYHQNPSNNKKGMDFFIPFI